MILRSREQMAQTVRDNPFVRAGLPEQTLYVVLPRDDLPTDRAIENLDPKRSARRRVPRLGSEVYLHLPNGTARTKLTNAYFDSKLSTVGTARNWATVLPLLQMMQV